MENLEFVKRKIHIDASKIPVARGMAIGRAVYNAYMKFVADPENKKMIMQEAEKIRTREATVKAVQEYE